MLTAVCPGPENRPERTPDNLHTWLRECFGEIPRGVLYKVGRLTADCHFGPPLFQNRNLGQGWNEFGMSEVILLLLESDGKRHSREKETNGSERGKGGGGGERERERGCSL